MKSPAACSKNRGFPHPDHLGLAHGKYQTHPRLAGIFPFPIPQRAQKHQPPSQGIHPNQRPHRGIFTPQCTIRNPHPKSKNALRSEPNKPVWTTLPRARPLGGTLLRRPKWLTLALRIHHGNPRRPHPPKQNPLPPPPINKGNPNPTDPRSPRSGGSFLLSNREPARLGLLPPTSLQRDNSPGVRAKSSSLAPFPNARNGPSSGPTPPPKPQPNHNQTTARTAPVHPNPIIQHPQYFHHIPKPEPAKRA